MAKKYVKILKRIGIGLAIFVVVLVVAVEVLLQTGSLTGVVRDIAADYVQGELQVRRITGSIITHFPKARLVLEDVTVTYPHDRFSYARGLSPDPAYTNEGRGAEADTLLSFKTLDATVSWIDAIDGAVNVRKLTLDSPRFFMHDYGNGVTNLDIFGSGEEEVPEEEKEENAFTEEQEPEALVDEDSGLFPLKVRDVALTGNPHFVYTSAADATYTRVDLEKILLDGTFSTIDADDTQLSLTIDALAASFQMPGDTIAVAFPEVSVRELEDEKMALRILADAELGMDGLGHILAPLGIESEFAVPEAEEGEFPLHIDRLTATVASLTAEGRGDVVIGGDRFGTDVELKIDKTSIRDLCHFLAQIEPSVGDIDTDATLTAKAALKGDFAEDRMPAIDARVEIPRSWVSYPGMARRGVLGMDAGLRSDAANRWNLSVDTLFVHGDGLHTGWNAGMKDMLGDDPLLLATGYLKASADSLNYLIPSDMDIDGRGTLALTLDGESRLSSLDAVRYPEARITANLAFRDFRLNDRTDDMRIFLPKADFDIRTTENRLDTSIPEGTQVLGLQADIDTVHFRYGGTMEARGRKLMLQAQNSVLRYGEDGGPMGTFTPFMVRIDADRFGYKDGDDLVVGMSGSSNSLRVASDSVDRQIPRITLESNSRNIFLREGVSRYSIGRRLARPGSRDTVSLATNPDDVFVSLKVSAKLNTFEKTRRRRAFVDSLRRQYPGVPKDSLMVRWRNDRFGGKEMPEWMQTEEFKSSDIGVDLDEDIKAYLRDWDVDGHAYIGGGRIVTPYFALPTQIDTLAADFTLDQVDLRAGSVRSGDSHLALSGQLKNLRRAVMGRGPYILDVHIDSDGLNADELMSAAAAGQDYDVEALRDSMSVVTVDDDRYEQLVVLESVEHEVPDIDLFVVPANLVANVDLVARNVVYGGLELQWLSGYGTVKERIIQLTNTVGQSNMGDFYLDAFYATQSMEDIGAGADLSLVGMDAGVFSEIFPELYDSTEGYVDHLSGNLEAQFAAVTRFDPQMNLDYPSMNGVLRITGGERNDTKDARRNLVIHNGPELRSLARWLPFISSKRIPIRNLEASVLVENGQLEILPMVVENRWYGLSIAGIQNIDPDQAFKYTISVIKSPLIFPFGVNLKGDDFDNFDYSLVGSKYWRVKSVPTLDSRKKVGESVDRLYGAIIDVYTLGVGGVIKAAAPARSMRELKEENGYEFAFLEDAMDENEEKELRDMQSRTEDISADDYLDRELTKIRKEVMAAPLPKKEDE